jgi:hypothetical protein
MENNLHANTRPKGAGIAALISYKIDFKAKTVRRDKEWHDLIIKGSVHQEDITILNLYLPNGIVPNFIKQTLLDLKGETGSNTIVENFNNPLFKSMNRSYSLSSIIKETQELNYTADKIDLTDIYRTFHPMAGEYTHSFHQHKELSLE